jgi:hypothetical protein
MVHLMGARFMMLLLQATPPAPFGMTPEQVQQITQEALKHRGSGAENVLGNLVPFALFAMVVAIVWLEMRKKQVQMRARAEFHKQLLDKFSSGREFAEFLGSAGSQRFLDEVSSQGPKERILKSMRTGVILTLLGLGMLGLYIFKRGFLVPGVLALALGLGFLIATAISYRLSKQWEQNQKPGPTNAAAS